MSPAAVLRLKRRLKAWGLASKDPAIRLAAKRIQEKIPVMGPQARKVRAAYNAQFPAIATKYSIGTHFHAICHGDLRRLSSIQGPVIHCPQYDGPTQFDQILGQMTESASYGASPHYGIDDDSIECYLPLRYIGWQALGNNDRTFGIEINGYAEWSAAQWMGRRKTLDRAAYVLALDAARLKYPLRLLSVAEIRAGKKGVMTHALITEAFGIAGGHTDPGNSFPMAFVLRKARAYLELLEAAKL